MAQLKELTRAEEAAERLSAEYEKKLLLLQQKESLELVKVSITSRRQAARGSWEGVECVFVFFGIPFFFVIFVLWPGVAIFCLTGVCVHSLGAFRSPQ